MTSIEQLLPCIPEFITQYQKNIQSGIEYLKTKNIVFLGLARNIAPVIDNNLNRLLEIGKQAKNYKIIIFENDSQDNTHGKIKLWTQKNQNIILLSEKNGRPQYGPVKDKNRTEALAEYRNTLKNYVADHFSNYDLVVVTDLDFIDFSEAGLYNSCGWLSSFSEIDAISGNSFEYRQLTPNEPKALWNYDSWAFRYNWWNELQPNKAMYYGSMLWFGFFIMPVGSSIMPVNSAFGGMTIYKLSQYIQASYEGYDCEHVTFHYNLKQIIKPKFQLVLNPSQIMLV